MNAAVVILHGVQRPLVLPNGAHTVSSVELGITVISAIGPGESGRTRYEVQELQSRLVFHDPQAFTAHTALNMPITLTYKSI